MKAQELRETFLNFFKDRGHTVVGSSGLVPRGDPTLLFTSAGMVQFKKLWSGESPISYRRAVSIQKCLRASDLDEVGRRVKYNTFFEMLGNFSFGDYFKLDAIKWAWEFMTKVLKLSEDKLYVSVLSDDTEAYKIWRDEVDIDNKKIFKLGKDDNFWLPAGGTGACGPCSEIFYDLSEDVGCGKPDCRPGCKCDRFPEVWNLVFPQYDSQPDGTLKPLKNRGIDTGMGLERLLMVVQGKKSLFETDLFNPIVDEVCKICDVKYEENKVSINIIADHIRALTFAVAEGVYPSNVSRGYLLRRLLRRAQREMYEFGVKKPFLYKLVPIVADVMRDCYPELVSRRESVALIIKSEEESFLRTLGQGLVVFNEVLSGLKSRTIPGDAVFKLYDTYGFPPELVEELATHKGFKVDKVGFDKVMNEAKERTKMTGKFKDSAKVDWTEIFPITVTDFVGYKVLRTRSKVAKWRQVNDNIEIVLDRSPFYAEAGGQIGDCGKIYNSSMEVEVLDTKKLGDLYVHIGKLKKGNINNKMVICEVDKDRRKAVEQNHTGTHLIHSALRKVLGDHVHQDGSLVEADRFRFDFTHFKPLSNYEIEKVESLVNGWILENITVKTYVTSFDAAVDSGATAIFGEKYGDKVRVVRIGDISMELCGGTHVRSTAELIFLKIISETGIHTGIRRVEVLTGATAIKRLMGYESDLVSISDRLGVEPSQVKDKVYNLIEDNKKLRDRLMELERVSILNLVPEILSKKEVIDGIDVLISKVPTENIEILRILADKLRVGSQRVGVLCSVINGKPVFITFVSDDLKSQIKASIIANKIGKLAGGGGGGKDTIGQAGGKDTSELDYVLGHVPRLISEIIK
ncbi:MAG: alanine--tRNA ligase [bacterium]|nr:alanine--tRNA ligase [bacterium]